MIKVKSQLCRFSLLICSSLFLSACDKNNSSSEASTNASDTKVMQDLITEPVKAFPQTRDDPHDIALLIDFDTRFNQMSDDMEDELNRMQQAGTLTADFSHNRKRDNVESALTMLKDLDLKTEQGRYIQGLIAAYWQIQAETYQQQADKKAPSKQLHTGLGEFLHAQEQLEYWQSQYPDLAASEAKAPVS